MKAKAWLGVAILLACGALSQSSRVFAQESTPPIPASPAADAAPTPVLADRQQNVAERYRKLEELLLRLADVEADQNAERANLLRQAAKQSRDMFVLEKLNTAGQSLRSAQFQNAIQSQAAAKEGLDRLLTLLLSEDRSRRIRDEKDRVDRMIKELKLVERVQRSTRARTENGQDLEALGQEQESLADRAGKVREAMQDATETEAAESEPTESAEANPTPGDANPKPGAEPKNSAAEPKAADGKPGAESESKPGEPMPSEPGEMPADQPPAQDGTSEPMPQQESKPGDESKPEEESKPGDESKPGEKSKPGEDSKPGEESKPGEPAADSQPNQPAPGQSGESPAGELSPAGEQQPQSPEQEAQQQVQRAIENMRQAQKELEQAKREPAVEKQRQAEENLRAAIDRLEKILRQLREEEIQRELARLEARLRKMAQMQGKLLDDSKLLEAIPESQRDRQFDVRAGNLAFEEKKIVMEADRALLLLREEGSSVAFPEVVAQIRDDMQRVAERLTASQVDAVTLGIQEDILAALEEMITALQKAQRDMEQQRQQQQPPPSSQPGQGPGEQPLVEQIAELKLIRTMETRILATTQRYSKIAAESAGRSDLLPLVRDLAERQGNLYRITRDIVQKRNQ